MTRSYLRSNRWIWTVRKILNKRLRLHDLDKFTQCLGIELFLDESNHICFRKRNLIDNSLEKHGMKNIKHVLNSMSPDIEMRLRSKQLIDSNAHEFQIIVGRRLYLCTYTWRDICVTASRLESSWSGQLRTKWMWENAGWNICEAPGIIHWNGNQAMIHTYKRTQTQAKAESRERVR